MDLLASAARLSNGRAERRLFPIQRINDADAMNLSGLDSTTIDDLVPYDQFGAPILSYKTHPNPPDLLYIREHEKANAELAWLFRGRVGQSMPRVVGFDVEWRPRSAGTSSLRLGENRIAVVQIASTRKILVLHVSAMEVFPGRLKDLLKDESILKAGVNILGDAHRMYRDFGVTVRSCVELSYLARTLDPHRWPGNPVEFISLARLVSEYMNRSLPKNGTRRSNWEEDILTREQIDYAANDAHASLVICSSLLKRAKHLDRSLFMFDVVRGSAVHASGHPWQYQHASEHIEGPHSRPLGLDAEFSVPAPNSRAGRSTHYNILRAAKVRHLRSSAPASAHRHPPRLQDHRRLYNSPNGGNRVDSDVTTDILNRLKQLHLCPQNAVIKPTTRHNRDFGVRTGGERYEDGLGSRVRRRQVPGFLEEVVVATDTRRRARFGMRR